MPFDADLVRQCTDPSLTPAIVETFLKTVGSTDPLNVTVRSGSRVVLVPTATTPGEALATIRAHVGRDVVRVGVTQYPVGIGIKDPSEVSPDLLEACSNLRQGTALFGKVWRIVLNWYGNPTDESVMPQVLDDAIEAWQTGRFEGTAVFTAPEPGPAAIRKVEHGDMQPTAGVPSRTLPGTSVTPPNEAGIRVDLLSVGERGP